MNLHEKNILFCIVFGIRGCNDNDQFKIDETCKKGLTFAMHALRTVKDIAGIQSAFVGVSTGITFQDKCVYFFIDLFNYPAFDYPKNLFQKELEHEWALVAL